MPILNAGSPEMYYLESGNARAEAKMQRTKPIL